MLHDLRVLIDSARVMGTGVVLAGLRAE